MAGLEGDDRELIERAGRHAQGEHARSAAPERVRRLRLPDLDAGERARTQGGCVMGIFFDSITDKNYAERTAVGERDEVVARVTP